MSTLFFQSQIMFNNKFKTHFFIYRFLTNHLIWFIHSEPYSLYTYLNKSQKITHFFPTIIITREVHVWTMIVNCHFSTTWFTLLTVYLKHFFVYTVWKQLGKKLGQRKLIHSTKRNIYWIWICLKENYNLISHMYNKGLFRMQHYMTTICWTLWVRNWGGGVCVG